MTDHPRPRRMRFSSRILPVLVAVGIGALLSWGLFHRGGGDERADTSAMGTPSRVVLFAPNLTETAWCLGYGNAIVGITDFCVWPPQLLHRPRVGGVLDPSLERLSALHPDLLVVQGESNVLRRFAQQQEIPLATVKMDDDLNSIFAGTARLDSLMGAGEASRAPALIHAIRAEIEQVRRTAADTPRPTVLLVLGHEPGSLRELFTMGSGSFLNELVSAAGGRSQYAEHPREYFQLSLETLLAHPPDVAIELRPGERNTRQRRQQLRQPWRELGLENVRVELLVFDGLLIPGPRVGETARRLLAAIHPELPLPPPIAIPGSAAEGTAP